MNGPAFVVISDAIKSALNSRTRAEVVAQLVVRSLPIPEIQGSNPNIGKFYLPIVHLNRKDENKEKEAGNGPSLKK